MQQADANEVTFYPEHFRMKTSFDLAQTLAGLEELRRRDLRASG